MKVNHSNPLTALALFIMLVCISACTQGISDLEAWVDEVKARPQKGVEPLPEVIPYRIFTYEDKGRRDPFDSSIFQPKPGQKPGSDQSQNQISPDINRVPEYLESFPLDTLRMVGTMTQGDQNWALIKTPDNTIQRVLTGNYLGQNNGKIIAVSDDEVELTEIVPDQFGGWRERSASIALSQ